MTRSRAANFGCSRQDAVADTQLSGREFFRGGVGFSPQRRLQPASDLQQGAIMSIAISPTPDATC
jgi:hypothetical protein